MAHYLQRYEWGAWKGTPDDLEHLAELAAADLQLWSSKPPRFRATVVLRGGRQVSLDDVAELRGAVDRNADNVTELTLGLDVAGGSVEVRFRSEAVMGGGVSLSVGGDDESRVHGLALRLRERVDTGRRREPIRRGVLATIALLTAALLIASAVVTHEIEPTALRVGQLSGISVVAAFLVYERLVPSLELLRAGERSRLQRWGARVGAVIAASSLVLGIVALIAN